MAVATPLSRRLSRSRQNGGDGPPPARIPKSRPARPEDKDITVEYLHALRVYLEEYY